MPSRWGERELKTARALGASRQTRFRFESKADITPIVVRGLAIQAEVKTRRALPRYLVKGLEQARKYTPRAIPMLVISEHGGSSLVVLPLAAFCEIASIEPAHVDVSRKAGT